MMGSELFEDICNKTSDLLAQITESGEFGVGDNISEDSIRIIENHLKSCYTFTGGFISGCRNVLDLSIDPGCTWINSDGVDINDYSMNNIFLVDFFTHCCINCIHSIEDLRFIMEHLEDLYPNADKFMDVKLVSIHSPKFSREKDNKSVLSSVKRLNLDHSDVLNDPESIIWKRFGVCCWPTILIMGPNPGASGPNLLFALMGEGHRKTIGTLLRMSLRFFKERLHVNTRMMSKVAPVPGEECVVDGRDIPPTILRYPGKVCYYEETLAISDSGHNRIIIAKSDGLIVNVIGGKTKGFVDGGFSSCRFYNPQGIAFQNRSVFFVADTGNHAIRKIDLESQMVTTLMSPSFTDGALLKSPWDLTFHGPDVLLVAAAGNHQIFAYVFEPTLLFDRNYDTNTFTVIAGTGKEENRNNMYILKSSFAQPSGICCTQSSTENGTNITVFIADSESSSIRFISPNGRVSGLVGGSKNPNDLFAYGDVDGVSVDVKLQHPMGVCCGKSASKIFIADTYNHKVKRIDIANKHCTTLIGTGEAGSETGVFSGHAFQKKRSSCVEVDLEPLDRKTATLNEPGGIAIDELNDLLYVADTNNHSVKIADLRKEVVTQLRLTTIVDSKVLKPRSTSLPPDEEFDIILPQNTTELIISATLGPISGDFEGGNWKLYDMNSTESCEGVIETMSDSGQTMPILTTPLRISSNTSTLCLEVDVYLCGSISCMKKSLKFMLNVKFLSTEVQESKSVFSFHFNTD